MRRSDFCATTAIDQLESSDGAALIIYPQYYFAKDTVSQDAGRKDLNPISVLLKLERGLVFMKSKYSPRIVKARQKNVLPKTLCNNTIKVAR